MAARVRVEAIVGRFDVRLLVVDNLPVEPDPENALRHGGQPAIIRDLRERRVRYSPTAQTRLHNIPKLGIFIPSLGMLLI